MSGPTRLAGIALAVAMAATSAFAEQSKGTARPPDGSSKIIQKGGGLIDEKGVQPKAGTTAPAITSPRDPASGQSTGKR